MIKEQIGVKEPFPMTNLQSNLLIRNSLVRNKLVLTLIGMRQGTFHPLSFLDQILSAEFLSKISKVFGGEN